MIEVRDVARSFGPVRAVRGVRFDVPRGQIAGLLGANGAGKTTTIRMVTGFLPPDRGSVRIAGLDMAECSLEGRQRIGYLPESAPAYGEMRAVDFLRFRGRLYGLSGARLARAVAHAMDRCQLNEVRHRRVGHLSKGFRQRVGLAAAILHDPPVLVLDEPTNGLDPSQIRQARSLIRELAADRAVLMSSHILPEIELTCDRVIILSSGRIEADAPMAHLVGSSSDGRVIAEVGASGAGALAERLRREPGVVSVEGPMPMESGWARIVAFAPSSNSGAKMPGTGGDTSASVAQRVAVLASAAQVPVRELSRPRQTLERLFVSIIERARVEDAP